MPWTCPACSLAIRHSGSDEQPRLGAIYRCHICRLELIFDAVAKKLVLAPLREAPTARQRPRRGVRGGTTKSALK